MAEPFDRAFEFLKKGLAPLPRDLIDVIVNHELTEKALSRASAQRDRGHLLYSEDVMRIAEVYKNGDWNLDVLIIFKDRREPISVVSPTAIYVVSGSENLRSIEYSLSRPIDANYFDQEARVDPSAERFLQSGDWLFMVPNKTTGVILDPEPKTVVLRFLGPPEVPVVATFDQKTGNVGSLSMGGLLPTSQSFLVDLARIVLNGSEYDEAWTAYPEIEDLKNLLRNGMQDQKIHVATRWKIAQALVNHERDAVANFMLGLAHSDSPILSRKASKVLEQIDGAAHATV